MALNYSTFGMLMPGRNFSSSSYRFGFNGMEKDDEVKGSTGSSYTTYFRQYDPRLGRFHSMDPVNYPWQSDYAAFNNNPIYFADPSGAEGKGKTKAGRKRDRKQKKNNRKAKRAAKKFQRKNGGDLEKLTDNDGNTVYSVEKGIDGGVEAKIFRAEKASLDPKQVKKDMVKAVSSRLASEKQKRREAVERYVSALRWEENFEKAGGEWNYTDDRFHALGSQLQFALPTGKVPKVNLAKNSKLTSFIPEKAKKVLDIVKSKSTAPKGYKGGRTFSNDGRLGGEILPTSTPHGKPIVYKEWDVNPFTKGVNRGSERIVTGSNGKSYYTNNHYKSFTEM
ncbi:MAG: hypothetical protein COB15_08615 [Flavobacteriales bacterium]|nr:MAG: hypothetical protein COB15_08615 [Flavobacteriales bacterium]